MVSGASRTAYAAAGSNRVVPVALCRRGWWIPLVFQACVQQVVLLRIKQGRFLRGIRGRKRQVELVGAARDRVPELRIRHRRHAIPIRMRMMWRSVVTERYRRRWTMQMRRRAAGGEPEGQQAQQGGAGGRGEQQGSSLRRGLAGMVSAGSAADESVARMELRPPPPGPARRNGWHGRTSTAGSGEDGRAVSPDYVVMCHPVPGAVPRRDTRRHTGAKNALHPAVALATDQPCTLPWKSPAAIPHGGSFPLCREGPGNDAYFSRTLHAPAPWT